MAPWSCRKARQVIDNMPKILGVEALMAARAIYLTEPVLAEFRLGPGARRCYDALRSVMPFHQADDYMQLQIQPALAMVSSGAILDAVEASVGALG